jgi:hypothetical protein
MNFLSIIPRLKACIVEGPMQQINKKCEKNHNKKLEYKDEYYQIRTY